MIQATAAEEHPFFRFDVGNLDTLGADVGSSKSRATDKVLADQMDAHTPKLFFYSEDLPGTREQLLVRISLFGGAKKKVWSFFRRSFVCHFFSFLTAGNWATDNSLFSGFLSEWSRVKVSDKSTPPKINMEHNNGGLEDDFPFQIGDF